MINFLVVDKIIKDALCPVVVVDISMMHLALEKLASK